MLTNAQIMLAGGGPQNALDANTNKEQEFTSAAQTAIAKAHSLEIQCEDDLFAASQLMDGFKKAKKSVEDFFKPMKESAHRAHRAICDREKSLITPYDTADKAVKKKVSAYNTEQMRLAEIESARLKAVQEEESRRLLEEAVSAESSGNTAAAESLLKQAAVTETIRVPVTQEKVSGISFRTVYSVVVEDSTEVPCEINGVVIRPVDESAIKRLAQMTKGGIKIPGIKTIVSKEAYSR